MSKSKPTRVEAPRADSPEVPLVKPLKPRKGLFVVLCAAFAVWVGCLTTLYFKTVHGKQNPHVHQVVDQPPEKGP